MCIITTRKGRKKMKKNGILNSDISSVLSYMGHTDTITIGDCGLPIPENVSRIDLSLTFGEPPFIRVLELVLTDMKVEKITFAEEIKTQNPDMLDKINMLFNGQNVEVEFVPHTEFKNKTKNSCAIIRTGETTPYANIILQSGCIFG